MPPAVDLNRQSPQTGDPQRAGRLFHAAGRLPDDRRPAEIWPNSSDGDKIISIPHIGIMMMTWTHLRRLVTALLFGVALALVQTLPTAAQTAQETAQMRLYIQQLEAQVRQLTGEVERLRFELRRQQANLAPAADGDRAGDLTGSIAGVPAAGGPGAGQPAIGGPVIGGTVNPQNNASVSQGAPPQDLGTLSIATDDPRIAGDGAGTGAGPGGGAVAAAPLDLSVLAGGAGSGLSGSPDLGHEQPPLLPPQTTALSGSPSDQYDLSYGYILTGDYDLAEQSFRAWLQTFGDHELALDARFWLAESLYQQGENREAANRFLEVYKSAPDGRKAPDALMKLGLTLAALGERDAACATFAEMQNKFPDASSILSDRVAREAKKAGC
jgi:tol-pal system protein YbgF